MGFVRVLFVSKPICRPLHDGSQCLVRDVACHLKDAQASVMGVRGAEHPFDADGRSVEVRAVYSARGRFAPSTLQNARALLHLLTERRADVWHFVFAANPRTTAVLKQLRRVRHTPALQTIASPPRSFEQPSELLFGDRIVVQSEWTRRKLLEHAPDRDISVIPPSAPNVTPPSDASVSELRNALSIPKDVPVLVYPGDLEFSQGSRYFADLVAELGQKQSDCVFVYACRAKTPKAAEVEAALKQRLAGRNVRFTGELPSLLPLLSLATLVVFPTDSAYGKVDIPIALLEAMRLSVPVLSFDFGPLAELRGNVRLPLGDAAALVEATQQLIDDTAKRESVAASQREFLDRSLSPQNAAEQYERLYAQLVQ